MKWIKFFLNQMKFYGYHGVLKEETKLGQRFCVDVTLELALGSAGVNDDLNQSIDYGEVYERVKGIVEGRPYKLIEAVAEKISTELLSAYKRLNRCTVKVTKPDPPIKGHYHSVAVEMTRSQKDA